MFYYRQIGLIVGAVVLSIYCLVQAFRGIFMHSVGANPTSSTVLTGQAAIHAGLTWLFIGLIAVGFAALWFWLSSRD